MTVKLTKGDAVETVESEAVETTTIDLATLTPGQLAQLFAQMQAAQAAEKVERKKMRGAQIEFLGKFVKILGEKFSQRTFKSGAEGWSLGGTVTTQCLAPVKDADDAEIWFERDAKVSVLVRWADTIPAKDDATADAAEDSDSE